ncbi:hypothetical protein BDV96DRAFT_176512 [Lophiotrema nucula]|uniref:Uncharacterized protein n=1 Tax=Lophiotrema nucula TaxID=690887 RepID=A0A6A5Z072_9PLEO|nr:hypothetical protein BDV96DRAFT_176512 [Lophiotrema nucula]
MAPGFLENRQRKLKLRAGRIAQFLKQSNPAQRLIHMAPAQRLIQSTPRSQPRILARETPQPTDESVRRGHDEPRQSSENHLRVTPVPPLEQAHDISELPYFLCGYFESPRRLQMYLERNTTPGLWGAFARGYRGALYTRENMHSIVSEEGRTAHGYVFYPTEPGDRTLNRLQDDRARWEVIEARVYTGSSRIYELKIVKALVSLNTPERISKYWFICCDPNRGGAPQIIAIRRP